MANPKISVVLPTYNRSDLLREAVASVLSQKFTEFELIIVDDGSTDDTQEKIAQLQDDRIRYIYKQNGGLSSARNAGIVVAKSGLITFLDDDDLYLPEKLGSDVSFFEKHPSADWISAGAIITDREGTELFLQQPWLSHPELKVETLILNPMTSAGTIPISVDAVTVRTEWLIKVGGFDEKMNAVEDLDMWVRLAHAGCRFYWQPTLACKVRIHRSNMTRDGTRMRNGRLTVLDKLFSNDNIQPELLDVKEKAYAYAYLMGACNEIAAKQLDNAREDFQEAIHKDPLIIEENGKLILEMICNWANSPYCSDPVTYIDTAYSCLPKEAATLGRDKDKVIGRALIDYCFICLRDKNYLEIKRSIFRGVRKDPRWLFNRGVISLMVRSITNKWD